MQSSDYVNSINSLVKGYSRTIYCRKLLESHQRRCPLHSGKGFTGDFWHRWLMVLPMLGFHKRLLSRPIALWTRSFGQLYRENCSAAKEGLALINGTTVLTGNGALATMMPSSVRRRSSIMVLPVLFEEDLHTIRPRVDSWLQPAISATFWLQWHNRSHFNNGSKTLTPYVVFRRFMVPARTSIAYVTPRLRLRSTPLQITLSLLRKVMLSQAVTSMEEPRPAIWLPRYRYFSEIGNASERRGTSGQQPTEQATILLGQTLRTQLWLYDYPVCLCFACFWKTKFCLIQPADSSHLVKTKKTLSAWGLLLMQGCWNFSHSHRGTEIMAAWALDLKPENHELGKGTVSA